MQMDLVEGPIPSCQASPQISPVCKHDSCEIDDGTVNYGK